MITADAGIFRLTSQNTSYWFQVTAHGHLEHLCYGPRLPEDQSPDPLRLKRTAEIGTSIVYSGGGIAGQGSPPDPRYCLDNMCLEWSGIGCGDYRQSPIETVSDGYATDFTYRSHQVHPGTTTSVHLPEGYADPGQAQTLIVNLADQVAGLELTLEYTVFEQTDIIARRTTLRNISDKLVSVRKLYSLLVDLPNRDFRLLTLHGAWIAETHLEDRTLSYGVYTNSSTTGASSNRHNPGFLLAEGMATEMYGSVYGFNLVYSGNHCGLVERTEHDLVRICLGINPHCFEWNLEPGLSFETPQAVMTYSSCGLGQASRNFHDFVNRHIVRGDWRSRPRPVVYNNWEATFFKYRSGKLLHLARQAKNLGAELFVLDDGWFVSRDSDRAGLGDYTVNRRKFPMGLPRFADRVRRIGLGFGIWVEPEMVNPDSNLCRTHPDWAITTSGRVPCLGRNQLVLDLTRPEVRDYIVDNVSRLIDETQSEYVKWDFNRTLSDMSGHPAGEFFHRYILGLYEVLGRIFTTRPHVLLETCASGGNRFDLGMLCFGAQIWTSDDTDPIERLAIQSGASYLYPPSAMGAHVSQSPHQQTLRNTPLTTRFNVAAFGCLGYELDLDLLSPVERKEIREQIEFYKAHRQTLQYGRHHRTDRGCATKPNKVVWTMVARDGTEAVTLLGQTLAQASEGFDRLPIDGLDPAATYRVETRPQSIFISRFGALVKHLLPISLNPDGLIMRLARNHHRLTDAVESYQASGTTLQDGILLNNQFMGTPYNPETRLLGDFGSNLYLTTRLVSD